MLEHRIVYEEVPGSRTTQQAIDQPQRERIAYEELRPGDRIQPGDEWKNSDGRWQPYVCLTGLLQFVQDGHAARRPIGATQLAIEQAQRERIAYEELRPGTEVQPGDQYRNTQGRWVEYSLDTSGVPIVSQTAMARRPYNITQMLAEFANQAEVLAEVRADEERLVNDLELLRSKYLKLQSERDELRVEIQNLLKTITDNADMFADAGKILEQERDEARVKSERLQGLIDDLLDEPTARQVQDMLRTWVTELDWSVGCFGSFGRSQIDIIQQTMVAVIERIEAMIHPEGGSDGE